MAVVKVEYTSEIDIDFDNKDSLLIYKNENGNFEPETNEKGSNLEDLAVDLNHVNEGNRSNEDLSTFQKECNICKRVFYDYSKLEQHKNIHSLQFAGAYECNNCGKRFPSKSVIKTHLKRCVFRSFSCEKCGKKFRTKSDLDSHLKKHSLTFRSFYCAVCGKGFFCLNSLKSHCTIHDNVKLYKCEICEKSFIHPSSLRNHRVMHDASMPFKCDICGKGFKRSCRLTYHIRIHTGIKPYPCEICHKSFNIPKLLEVHKNIHLSIEERKNIPKYGQKNVRCCYCNKVFSYNNSLVKHLKRFHNGQ